MTFQFSLRELFALVSLVAVICGVLPYLWAAWQALGDGLLAASALVAGTVALVVFGISQGR